MAVAVMVPVAVEEEASMEEEWKEEERRARAVGEEEEGSEPETQRTEETVRTHRPRTMTERPTSC